MVEMAVSCCGIVRDSFFGSGSGSMVAAAVSGAADGRGRERNAHHSQ